MVTVFVQLAVPAAMLHSLPQEEYGRWLIISTIPLYLTLVDLGVFTASASKMTMAETTGNTDRVADIFSSSVIFYLLACLGICTVIFSGAYIAVACEAITAQDALILTILSIVALLSTGNGLMEALYAAKEKYHIASIITSLGRLADLLGVIGGVLMGGAILYAAYGVLLTRLMFSLLIIWKSRVDFPELPLRLKFVNKIVIFELISSGRYHFLMPVANLISIQGSLLLVGYVFGPAFAVIFNMHRVLSRIVYQISIVATRSISMEVSALHAQGEFSELNRLILVATRRTVLVSVLMSFLLIIIGPEILKIWSAGKIQFSWSVYLVLSAAATISSIWLVPAAKMMATENHRDISLFCLFVYVLQIFYMFITGRWVGGLMVLLALPVAEACIAVYVVRAGGKNVVY